MLLHDMCYFCKSQNTRFDRRIFLEEIKRLIDEERERIYTNLEGSKNEKSGADAPQDDQ